MSGSILRDKLCGPFKLDMPTPQHLSLQDPIVNLPLCTRPSGEGSVLSEKTSFSMPEGLVLRLFKASQELASSLLEG